VPDELGPAGEHLISLNGEDGVTVGATGVVSVSELRLALGLDAEANGELAAAATAVPATTFAGVFWKYDVMLRAAGGGAILIGVYTLINNDSLQPWLQ
jgi:hypothetical protein